MKKHGKTCGSVAGELRGDAVALLRLATPKWTAYRGLLAVVLLGLIALIGSPVRSSAQVMVRYEAYDLGDVVVGEDLWGYRFFVSGYAFGVDEGLSIFFDDQLYRGLAEASVGLDSKWDVLVIQPDVLLTADGFFDALATGSAPATVAPFVVEFVWLGGGGSEPGEVPFYTYDENFAVLASGVTSQVPEPGAWVLMSVGGVLGWWRWRRQTSDVRLQTSNWRERRERA